MATTSEYAEYRLLCADDQIRHRLDYPSVRGRAMEYLDRLGERECGPHRLQQQLVQRVEHGWTELLETDPQTESLHLLHETSKKIECPKCHEPVGQGCIDLRVWRQANTKTRTVWPHAERLAPAMTSES